MGVRDLWNRDRISQGIVDGDRRTRVFGKSIVYPPDLETSFHSSWKLPHSRGESPYMTILCTTKTLHGSCMFFLKKKFKKIFYILSGLFFGTTPNLWGIPSGRITLFLFLDLLLQKKKKEDPVIFYGV